MTKEQKLNVLKGRRDYIVQRGKYVKCPGVLKKVQRQIRNLSK